MLSVEAKSDNTIILEKIENISTEDLANNLEMNFFYWKIFYINFLMYLN